MSEAGIATGLGWRSAASATKTPCLNGTSWQQSKHGRTSWTRRARPSCWMTS